MDFIILILFIIQIFFSLVCNFNQLNAIYKIYLTKIFILTLFIYRITQPKLVSAEILSKNYFITVHIGANQVKRGFNYLESECSVQNVKLGVFGVREFISKLIRAI